MTLLRPFTPIAKTTKSNIKYSHKHLKNECDSTIFLEPTSKEEVANMISSLNSNKAFVQNSIEYEYCQICSTFLSLLVFFHWYIKLQR